MSADITVNVQMDSYGPVFYNGHWLTYGTMIDKWQISCVSCEEERSGSIAECCFSTTKMPHFWMSKFHYFNEQCEERKETFEDAMIGKIEMDEFYGMPKDVQTMREMQEAIETSITVGDVSADVDLH